MPDFRPLRIAVRHTLAIGLPARIVFEDVCDLAERSGACTAGDKHFAAIYGVSTRTVRRWFEELRDHGYLISDGATKDRKLVPADPALRTPSVLGHRTPSVLNGADLGRSVSGDLGRSVTDTKSISSSSERGRGTRAHEADETKTEAPSADAPQPDAPKPGTPTLADVLARASVAGVPAAVAEEFFWHYEKQGWRTSGANSPVVSNWIAALMSWKLKQASFDRKAAPRRSEGGATGTMRDLSLEVL